VTVSPNNGYALSTMFLMSTTGWTADASSLPLGYIFSYQLSINKGALVLNVRGPKPYVSSPLPPGLPTLSNIVTVFVVAVDIYGGTANASAPVTIVTSTAVDPSDYLKSLLGKSLSSGNLDKTFSTINLVSSTISIVDCTASPICTALHRSNCFATINTCGSCLSGYLGVVGDSNAKCFSVASNSGSEGAPCFTNSTCLYGYCAAHKCATPNQQCQSNSPYTICSGNGVCHFTDMSGNTLKQCLITSPFCTAACQCRTEYGGVDCSLDAAALLRRENARVSMCTALLSVISVSPKSSRLFDSVVAALESAYDYTEITTLSGRVTCSKVLRFLGVLASKGYLGTSLLVSKQTFTEITSQFVKSAASNPKHNGRRQLTLAGQFATDVAYAVAGLTTGKRRCAATNTHPIISFERLMS
jgi:REJ domain